MTGGAETTSGADHPGEAVLVGYPDQSPDEPRAFTSCEDGLSVWEMYGEDFGVTLRSVLGLRLC